MSHTTKIKFADLQRLHTGRICIMSYAKGAKSLAFMPVASVESNLACECGHSMWNATNFGGLVHFCPNREIEVTITDYTAVNANL